MARIILGQQIKELEKNLRAANLEVLAQKQTVNKLDEANRKNIQRIDGCKATLAAKNQTIEDLRKDNAKWSARWGRTVEASNESKETIAKLATQLREKEDEVRMLNENKSEALATVELGLYIFYPEALGCDAGTSLKPEERLFLRLFDILDKTGG